MATTIYRSGNIYLIDGTQVYMTPLKIKYLRQFMDKFSTINDLESEEDKLNKIIECVTIAMQQYYPEIKTTQDLEDSVDLKTIYEILDYAAGIKMSKNEANKLPKNKNDNDGTSWQDIDLAALESEVFLLGIWKDYEELEESLSMPELTATISAKREIEYNDKKFLAAIQGVDLDKQSGKQNAWEEMKARVFSKGATSDSNDVIALQGANAQKAGFGIGMGLSYQKID